MIVQPWEKLRAQRVADASKDTICQGVFGADTIYPTLPAVTRLAILNDATLDPQIRLAAYGMFAGLQESEPFTPLAFAAGWGNVASGWAPGGTYRDGTRVHTRGLLIFSPGVLTSTVATLPINHRPAYVVQMLVRGGLGGACYVHVYPSGVLEFNGPLGDANASVSLDGLVFDIRA